MIRGHEAVLGALCKWLPDAALFLGPFSVGRWEAAEYLRRFYSIAETDLLRVHTLDVESAGTILEFTMTPPVGSPFKLVIVELYGSTNAAQVALTSALEYSRRFAKIIVISSGDALPGVRSRCVTFRFGTLRTEDVAEILMDRYSFSSERAHGLAARSGGQIYPALQLANADDQLSIVREALHALRTHDEDALMALSSRWTDECTGWLAQWCTETISGQWRVFDHEDYVAGKALPLKILMATQARVRPKLVVRSQLMRVLKGD